jgi:hypothetical protein
LNEVDAQPSSRCGADIVLASLVAATPRSAGASIILTESRDQPDARVEHTDARVDLADVSRLP